MRIALLSTSDTDLLSARASGADYVWANPARPGHQSMAATIEGADLVVGRILASLVCDCPDLTPSCLHCSHQCLRGGAGA